MKLLLNNNKFNNRRLIEGLASQIRDVASLASNEGELRIGVEKILELLTCSYGIDIHPRYEKKIAQRGGIPCFKISYTWRFKLERINQWIEAKDISNKRNRTFLRKHKK